MPAFHLGAFLKNFWINPRKYPDFGWAWLTRFVPFVGYFLGITSCLLPGGCREISGCATRALTLSIIAAVVSLLSTVLGGFLSDRFQRRKLFVIAGMIIMAVSFLLLAFFQSWIAVLVAAAVLGFGLGAYLAVDVAIVTLVLPSAKNRAKDMGIINTANTLPHSVAPVFAGLILALRIIIGLVHRCDDLCPACICSDADQGCTLRQQTIQSQAQGWELDAGVIRASIGRTERRIVSNGDIFARGEKPCYTPS